MRIKSIVPALALALAAIHGGASAWADPLQYLGPSTSGFNGGQGYIAYFNACTASFPPEVNATWCTSRMIIEGGPAPSAPSPTSPGEWVNTEIVAGIKDMTVDLSSIPLLGVINLNCDRWTVSTSTETGLVFSTEGGQENIFILPCNSPNIKVACCGEPGRWSR